MFIDTMPTPGITLARDINWGTWKGGEEVGKEVGVECGEEGEIAQDEEEAHVFAVTYTVFYMGDTFSLVFLWVHVVYAN